MNKLTPEQAREIILSFIKPTPTERKELIKKCVTSLGFTIKDMEYEEPGGKLNLAKVTLGSTLNQLIRTGMIIELEDGRLKISKEEFKIAEIKIEVEEIINSLTAKKAYEKDELLSATNERYFKKHAGFKNNEDYRNTVRGYAGNYIKNCVPMTNGKYGLDASENLREQNEMLLKTITSQEFESHTVNMLTQYYKTIYNCDCSSYIIGGQGDGGIDGVIEVKDPLLKCVDKIFIQVKQKQSENSNAKNKTLHEVREFFGVLTTNLPVAKGLFVTNVGYTPLKEIERFKSCPFVYVNGKTWLDMADKCNYSINKNLQ